MSARDRIILLLENYVDVVNGLRDRTGDGVHIPLMCRAWNKPLLGYPELERLRLKMRDERPDLYWHLSERYLRSGTKRILVCPWVGDRNQRCEVTFPAWSKVTMHTHGRRTVSLLPATVATVHPSVDAAQLRSAVEWLESQWRGDGPQLPTELQDIATRNAA